MKVRPKIGIALLALSLPFLFFGLIDALEGGISMVFAGILIGVAHVLLKKKPAKYLWVPYVVTIVLAMVTLGYAVATLEFSAGPTPLPIPVSLGNWLYRVGVLVTLVATVITLVRSFRFTANT